MSKKNKNSPKLVGALLTGVLNFSVQTEEASSLFSIEDWGSATKLRTELMGGGSDLIASVPLELTCGEGKCGEGKCAGHKGKKHNKSSKKTKKSDRNKAKKQQVESSTMKSTVKK